MHEAYAAERAKDWARAKTLYLDAWAEHHPSPRALENAARMAGLAGDAAESRRLRDRALAEAEGAEHATAQVRAGTVVTKGSARLAGTVLTLALDGKVVARDTVTGELRVLLDENAKDMTLSRYGTLAFSVPRYTGGTLVVYDVLTGKRLRSIANATNPIASPEDKLVALQDAENHGADADHHARVVDVATGQVTTQLSAAWSLKGLLSFSSDDARLLAVVDDGASGAAGMMVRRYDLAKKAAEPSVRLPAMYGVAATSLDGRYLTYLEQPNDGSAIHVRDLTTNTEITQWTSKFHSVEGLAISPDGKTLATGSRSSLRLWDVAQKKQLFKMDASETSGATNDADTFDFSDDGKTMVVAGWGTAMAWDVATGATKRLVPDATPKNVLHVMRAPDGVAIILEDEVRIVPTSGEPRTVCKGLPQPYSPVIGPTRVAFSASGKSMACVMSDGWVHVLDATSWTEKAVIKRGAASPIDRPVDLVFSADEKTLTDVSNVGFVTYDAASGAETSRVTFRHGGVGFAPRHARFDDGTIAVRLWNGSAAIFGADGAWQRDVKLVATAPIGALDAFAAGGKTYAVALGTTLHVVDLTTGDDRTTSMPSAIKSLAVSGDGKSVLVAGADGVVSTVQDGAATQLAHAKGTRVAFAAKSVLVWADKNVVDAYALSAAPPLTLEVDVGGVAARDGTGAFEVRGNPELVCVVGATFLSRMTCDDRAKEGLVAKWLSAL
jgi:WD40 repeat protein